LLGEEEWIDQRFVLRAILGRLEPAMAREVDILGGWVLSGALVAAWALTYARHVCAAQPLDWRAFAEAISTGGMVAPIVALAELLIGEPVWIAIGTGVVLWLLIVTPDGQFTLPRALRALFPPLPPRAG